MLKFSHITVVMNGGPDDDQVGEGVDVFQTTWFSAYNPQPFEWFGSSHVCVLSVFLIGCVILYLIQTRLKQNKFISRVVQWSLFIMLIVPEFGLHMWYFQTDQWTIQTALPLELCSISLIGCAIQLHYRMRWMYPFLLFAGTMGALQALLTPALVYGFPHFRFVHFFLSHTAIIWTVFYLIGVDSYRPTWRSIGGAFITLNLVALVVGVIDYAIGANYMFLMHKPTTASLFDLFGARPYDLLAVEGLTVLLFAIVYVTGWGWRDVVRRRMVKSQSSM